MTECGRGVSGCAGIEEEYYRAISTGCASPFLTGSSSLMRAVRRT
jgi:hypothetical protein